MTSTRNISEPPSRLGWTVLGLILAWNVAQSSLLQFPATSAPEGAANVLFILGVGLSLAWHEVLQDAAGAVVRRRDRSGGGACGKVAPAACGPLASALLAIAVLITDRVVYLSGLADPLVRSLAALGTFNIVLAAANLAPAAPMDGGRLLRVAILTTGRDVRRGEGLAGASGEVIGLLIVTCGFVAALADGLAEAFTWILVGVIVFAEGRGVSLRAAGLPAGPGPDAGPQPLGAKPPGPKPLGPKPLR